MAKRHTPMTIPNPTPSAITTNRPKKEKNNRNIPAQDRSPFCIVVPPTSLKKSISE